MGRPVNSMIMGTLPHFIFLGNEFISQKLLVYSFMTMVDYSLSPRMIVLIEAFQAEKENTQSNHLLP